MLHYDRGLQCFFWRSDLLSRVLSKGLAITAMEVIYEPGNQDRYACM